MSSEQWASDTEVSFPEPPPAEVPVLVDFEGFGFSMNGIVHNLSGTDLEEMVTPYFAPEGYQGSSDLEPLGIQGDHFDGEDYEDEGEM